jgi:hypothetical protein
MRLVKEMLKHGLDEERAVFERREIVGVGRPLPEC